MGLHKLHTQLFAEFLQGVSLRLPVILQQPGAGFVAGIEADIHIAEAGIVQFLYFLLLRNGITAKIAG